MVKMDTSEVEEALHMYPAFKAHIANMRRWLLNRTQGNSEQERVQPGSPGDPTYAIVRDLMTDPGYIAAVILCDAIEAALEQLDPTAQKVIKETYFRGGRRTQEGIALACQLSRSQVYEVRRESLEYFAGVLSISHSTRKKLQQMAAGEDRVIL